MVLGVLAALVSAPSSAAVAVLAADAPGLLPGAREPLEAAIHTAVVAAGFEAQPQARTARFIKDAVDAGLDCSLVDDECALRAGIAAGADGVIVPQVRRVGERTVVVLRWLALSTTPRTAAATIDDTDTAGSLLALARRLQDPAAAPSTVLPILLGLEPADAIVVVAAATESATLVNGHVWLDPGPHTLHIAAAGHDTAHIDVVVAADALPASQRITLKKGFPALAGIGLGLAGVGGVLVVGGGIGAGICEVVLSSALEPTTRSSVSNTGRLLVTTAVAGIVVAAVGGTLVFVGLSE